MVLTKAQYQVSRQNSVPQLVSVVWKRAIGLKNQAKQQVNAKAANHLDTTRIAQSS